MQKINGHLGNSLLTHELTTRQKATFDSKQTIYLNLCSILFHTKPPSFPPPLSLSLSLSLSLDKTYFLGQRHFQSHSSTDAPLADSWAPHSCSHSLPSGRGYTFRGTGTSGAPLACVWACAGRSSHCWGRRRTVYPECSAPGCWNAARRYLAAEDGRLQGKFSACASAPSGRPGRRCVSRECLRGPPEVACRAGRAGPCRCCRGSRTDGSSPAGVPGRTSRTPQCRPYAGF